MSYKIASYISLAFFFVVALMYFISAQGMPEGDGHDVGPGYFPSILSFLMMVACVVGVFTTWRRPDDPHIQIPKPGKLLFTASMAALFLLAWYLTGRFYPLTFVTLFLLMFVLNPEPHGLAKAGRTAAISAVFVAVIYIIFGYILELRL